ncbi:MAG TPA: ribosome biogenesis GTP-binding protein YihA/YsxC [bacterium]|nr:ribosome biogenesis GTP-binding protein YihA/YsxC [bacterium]
MKIVSAEFVLSAAGPEQWPREGLAEAAFSGRSNVGKSSLINALVRRHKLARTSSTPGQTRSINFFRVNGKYMFADLPGFGYAKVAKEERRRWRRMVESYLAAREELRAVVLIMDLRRTPGAEERELIGFLTSHGIPPLLVATKADKLSRNRRVKPLRELGQALGIAPDRIVIFSAVTGEGMEELWKRLLELLSPR